MKLDFDNNTVTEVKKRRKRVDVKWPESAQFTIDDILKTNGNAFTRPVAFNRVQEALAKHELVLVESKKLSTRGRRPFVFSLVSA